MVPLPAERSALGESGRTTFEFPLSGTENSCTGVAGFSLLLVTFLIAVANLTIFPTTAGFPKLASVFWVGMVLFMVIMDFHLAGGFAFWVNGHLMRFAKRHWVRIVRNDSAPPTISIGFELFGRDFDRFRTELSNVTKIDWTSGQATALSGIDSNDWHVAMWYLKNQRSGTWNRLIGESTDLVLIGPQGTKTETAELGERFVGFLAKAGVDLIQVSEAEYGRNSGEAP